jgi:alanine racemase
MHRPVVCEIDLGAIAANVRAIRKAVGPGVKILPAVKADGYGHGAVEVSRVAIDSGADMLGVAGVEEAIELREGGVSAPILILGCTGAESARELIENRITATVCEIGFAKALAETASGLGKRATVHVKVDTGMGRIGVPAREAVRVVEELSRTQGLEVEGIFTHFPSADEKGRDFTEAQIGTFKSILTELEARGVRPAVAHTANSGAILDYPESYLDIVRPGIMFYGCYPSLESSRSIPLVPALTFKTRIVFLKEAEPGITVSYGRSFTTSRRTKVATIAVGYADGYSRFLSGKGEVAVRGCRVPVLGRVCMDQVMIDVTDVPGVEVGDEVVLFGGGYDFLAIENIAEVIGTIPHDVCCAIGKRVPRVYK